MGGNAHSFFDRVQIYTMARQSTESRQRLFEAIWDHYHGRLYFFIRQFTETETETEDVLQDVMLKIYQHLHQFNPFYRFTPWVYTIARNHCLNLIRDKKIVTQSGSENAKTLNKVTNGQHPEKTILAKEQMEIIDSVINKLEPTYRQMAYLRFFEGLRINQIARILDVPTGTVKSRLHLIRKSLSQVLEQYHAD